MFRFTSQISACIWTPDGCCEPVAGLASYLQELAIDKYIWSWSDWWDRGKECAKSVPVAGSHSPVSARRMMGEIQ